MVPLLKSEGSEALRFARSSLDLLTALIFYPFLTRSLRHKQHKMTIYFPLEGGSKLAKDQAGATA